MNNYDDVGDQITWLVACRSDWLGCNSSHTFNIHSCFSSSNICHNRSYTWSSLVCGIERILQGIVAPGKSRWGTIGLGILVLIISIIVMALPGVVGAFLIILLAIGLLFDGIARVYHGATDKTKGKWSRIFSIAAGVIEIGLSLMIMAAPVIGVELVSFLLAIALLIVGIQIIAAGVSGRRIR